MPFPADSLFPSDELFLDEFIDLTTVLFSEETDLSVELNEEFNTSWGQWDHYDTYDPDLRDALRSQKHRDIRNFRIADIAAQLDVLELSQYSLDELSGQTMSQIEGLMFSVKQGEHWTAGTNISDSAHNYWKFLSLPVASGTTDTASVIPAINILDGFENDDFISLALPDFPLTSITQGSSYVQFTSNPTGDFAVGPTASVPLSATILPLIADNSEFRVLRSAFNQNTIDLSKITGVRLRMVAIGPATVKFGALRILAKTWQYPTVDFDTRLNTLVRPVSPNGDPAYPIGISQPIVWRAAEFPGEEDPRPIDFNLAVGFNTGSRARTNQISIYGRELTEDFMQQIDLNGSTQGSLSGHEQPDVGGARFSPRFQTDLDPFKQQQLEGLNQFDLERTPDYLAASWIEFVLQWNTLTTQISVVNTEGNGYNFDLGLALNPNSNYVLVYTLNDTAAQAAIYPLGDRGEILFESPVFDSTLIDDDFSYKRRKGRFGWFAQLGDGDASVDSIRFRSASYAEYRSLPFESTTPVIGAELSADSSPIIDRFSYFIPTGGSTAVVQDREKSTSGESWKVTDYGDHTYQGIQSNPFQITDFSQTEFLLDVYYPSAPDLEASLEFFLKSPSDYLIPLPKPRIYPDQWQTIRLRTPSAHLAQTGFYRLAIIQSKPFNINWWVDKVRISERTVSWYGRAAVEDPWAATEDDWTAFQNSTNRDFGGILFQGRERKMQVKAIGHKQESTIGKVQFKPKYAELGRFVWPEDALVGQLAPTASYSSSHIGRNYTFNGFGSSDPDGVIINWYWTFSDGTVLVGPIVQHEFGTAGTYSVTLTAMDQNGLIDSVTNLISVV